MFNENRYFDVFVEYAKGSPEDILVEITIANRGPEAATIHLLPMVWFRNTWSWSGTTPRPVLRVAAPAQDGAVIALQEPRRRPDGALLRRESGAARHRQRNEYPRSYLAPPARNTPRTASTPCVVQGRDPTPSIRSGEGTKAAAKYVATIPAGGSVADPGSA